MEKSIPLSNLISATTDGALAMLERYCGFIIHLKQNVAGVFAVHCVIRRQHLVEKNVSGRFVLNAVNKIRSNTLNTTLLAQMCEENDDIFHGLSGLKYTFDWFLLKMIK